ncbi:MAG: fasciclin domain-containing protein [Prevotella sp.]|nr:fasciclin domain-containing protein [Prevotella sp.]
MIFKNALVVMAALVAGAMTTSCSDWDDHYDPTTAVEGSASATLWENISSNSSLSQFADLLRKTGYDEVLKASQTYTVWAPLNDTFDYSTLSQEGSEKLLKEFVQNHVARNNYAASGVLDEQVYMLNEKVHSFVGSAGTYTINGVSVAQSNLASSNGVMHTISGKLQFLANIYESLDASEFAIDSISDYFHSFDQRVLNISKSVEGPVVDGEITYLDSVFDESNSRFSLYSAYINSEDSNYTMVIPTNTAWEKAKNAMKPYFNYIPSLTYRENAGASGSSNDVAIEIDDIDYLRDSVMNLSLFRGLFFNNNLYDNGALNTLATGQRLQVDSLVTTSYRRSSTSRQKLYSEDAAALFEGTTRVDKSNGAIFVTDDSLRVHPWLFWNPMLENEAELSTNIGSVSTGRSSIVTISAGTKNPAIEGTVSNDAYLELSNSTASNNPVVNMYLKNLLSTTYVIYAVILPPTITNPAAESKPNAFTAQLFYNRENGSIAAAPYTFGGTGHVFFSDSSKIDTVCLGEYTFPMAYAHIPDNPAPYVRITGAVGRKKEPLTPDESYDRVIRLDCLLAVPKELDDYMKEHPDYVYPRNYK